MHKNDETIDPGISGTKLSKSESNETEERNKSYNKVLDAQIGYIWAVQAKVNNPNDFLVSWKKKSAWHEKEFGW